MNLRDALDPYARRLTGDRLYLAYTLRGEHVGTLDPFVWQHPEFVIKYLETNGYEPSPSVAGVPLEAAKRHPQTGKPHDFSYRKVAGIDDVHAVNTIADRTPKARHGIVPKAEQLQFHVHGWVTPRGVELHSHFEWRPELGRIDDETHAERYHRLRAHYRPSSYGGGSYLPGVTDSVVAEMVESA